MSIAWIILLLLVGLLAIIKGGDVFIDAAVGLADATGIPKMLVGATIVSFATVLPELMISALAAVQGATDLSLANNMGSVIFNTGVVLAISLVAAPQRVDPSFTSKGLLMVLGAVYLLFAAWDRSIGVADSIGLLALVGIYVYTSLRQARLETEPPTRLAGDAEPPWGKYSLRFVGGAVLIVIGAQLMVNNGVALAAYLGVPERVIGLTIVAMGSSLPELVTTLTSLIKKEFHLGVGNILGANTLNLVLLPPISSLLSDGDLPVSLQKLSFWPQALPTTTYIDIPVALLLLSLVALPGILHGRLYRWQGLGLLLIYGGYLAFLLLSLP